MSAPTAVHAGVQDSAGGRSLRITSVETTALRAPLAREFRGSYYRMTHRATVITRIHTEDGIVGEAYVGDEDGSLAQLQAITATEIAPRLTGLDAFEIENCWLAGYRSTFDILRDRRLGLVALAGVDTAIWDAVGKALRIPLWKLWGAARDRVPMIAIGGYYGEPLGSIADEVAAYRELGLAGMKFKVGGASPQVDAQRVEAARAAAGDDWVIAINANQGYSVADAVELSQRLRDLGVRWFEEPVHWQNDRRGMRDVRYRGALPVCAGQSEYSPAGCRDLMEASAVDVCNFDASWSGGPTAWRRAAAIATTYDVQMAHHEEPQVSAHLIASQPHGTFTECFHPDRDPFWWNLIATPRRMQDGHLLLSETPGLGWELDPDYIARYRVSG
jgi:L-alanine-DL-glutamate epimerase-like enolase superfamily enzyme